jgi:tripartite-type tricarboxylate transporter receptor subunit TctC
MIPAKAETLNIVVHRMGIGVTLNAQILAKYFNKHNDEITRVVFREIPGAGGVTAANYIYEIAPRDGLTIGAILWHNLLPQNISEANVKYDPSKFTWLGSTMDGRKDAILLLTNKDNIINIGFQRSDYKILTQLFSAALNKNIKPVLGYRDQNELRFAFERGEVDALVNTYFGLRTTNPDWLARRPPAIQFGNGTKRHADFPDVPTLSELINHNELKRQLELYEKQTVLLRPFVAPPGLSQNISVKLRNMFARAVSDPKYIAEAKKSNIDVSYVGWKEAEEIVQFLVKPN